MAASAVAASAVAARGEGRGARAPHTRVTRTDAGARSRHRGSTRCRIAHGPHQAPHQARCLERATHAPDRAALRRRSTCPAWHRLGVARVRMSARRGAYTARCDRAGGRSASYGSRPSTARPRAPYPSAWRVLYSRSDHQGGRAYVAPLQSIHNQQPAAALVERQEAGVGQPTTKTTGLGCKVWSR